ncbi:hypothetical protein [Enterobacter bugandensis]|uniref:hypothetical protein n=1 Tax=Enterobacter bugandensis TaxID=881260 RepID=UPI002D778FC4|nr:hypothetical protein [Enterobacter bugandensis]WRT49681.1 hypothetical protein VK758_13190 [Enterobacter bugandensis]
MHASIPPALISASLLALAGLFGGVSISFFWQPQRLHQHSKFIAGIIFGGISMGAAVALGGLTARWLKIDLTQPDITMGLGYILGAMSNGLIVWLANFFAATNSRIFLMLPQSSKKRCAMRHSPIHP